MIENGYDEESFPAAGAAASRPECGKITLLHSGIVYPNERDPSRLIEALKLLQSRGIVDETNFRIRFRAPAHAELLRSLAGQAGVAQLLEIMPSVNYQAAIDEMLRADALLLLQAANCNQQIPAKLYEYLRCRRPILALTDPAGDTALTLRNAGCDRIAKLDDAEAIASLLTRLHSFAASRRVQSAARRRGRRSFAAKPHRRARGAARCEPRADSVETSSSSRMTDSFLLHASDHRFRGPQPRRHCVDPRRPHARLCGT